MDRPAADRLRKMLARAYDDSGVPIRELLALVWRAGDADGRLAAAMAGERAYRCMEICANVGTELGTGPESTREAVVRAQEAVWEDLADPLGRDIGLRAAAGTLRWSPPGFGGGHTPIECDGAGVVRDVGFATVPGARERLRFVGALFAVGTEVLAWRDLSGYVGLVERARTLRQAERLEAELVAEASRIVGDALTAPGLWTPEIFAGRVDGMVDRIKRPDTDDATGHRDSAG